jgi:hypothetical protein
MKKIQSMHRFSSGKSFWLHIFGRVAVVGEKSVINMI